jgi:hypothetical protein
MGAGTGPLTNLKHRSPGEKHLAAQTEMLNDYFLLSRSMLPYYLQNS